MQTLNMQDVKQVNGGIGPWGAAIGATAGAINGARKNGVTGAVKGAALGGLAGATGGLAAATTGFVRAGWAARSVGLTVIESETQ